MADAVQGMASGKVRTRRSAYKALVSKAIKPVVEGLEVRRLLSSVPAGGLDTTFGTAGKVITNVSGTNNVSHAVTALSNGDIVAAGQAAGRLAVALYGADGALLSTSLFPVTTASSTGTSIIADGTDGSGDPLVLVAGAIDNVATNNDFLVARYKIVGSGSSQAVQLDTSFDAPNGYTTTDINSAGQSDMANAIAASGSDVILAGSTGTGTSEHLAVAAYSLNTGSPDATFGTNGVYVAAAQDVGNGLAIDPSGNIVVAGQNLQTLHSELTILNSSATVADVLTPNLGAPFDSLSAVVASGGEYLVAGNAGTVTVIAKVTSTGSLDGSFGTNGQTRTNGPSNRSGASAMAIQSNGKIDVAGFQGPGPAQTFFIVRYNADGSLDSGAFGAPNGYVATSFGAPTPVDGATGLAIQTDGQIIAAGFTNNGPGGTNDFALARYVSNNAPTASNNTTSIGSVNQNNANPAGTSVHSIITGLNVSDIDGDSLGIAITATDNSRGTWQYSTNFNSPTPTWTNVPAVSDASALTLADVANNGIRLVPNGQSPGSSSITVRAWDLTKGADATTTSVTANAAANYNSFSDNTYSASITINFTGTTVYVDHAWAGSQNGSNVSDAQFGTHVFGVDAFGTIQDGANNVPSGGTVDVAPGLYHENVTVFQPESIVGPNAGVAGSAARSAEAEVMTNGNQGAVFDLLSSNVTISGFYIEGDDPSLTGGPLTSGADSNALYGVLAGNANPPSNPIFVSNETVQDNVVKDVFVGFRGDGPAAGSETGSLVTSNWFDSIGAYDFGYTVTLRNNFYADVANNLMTRVQSGLHTNNFSNNTGPASWFFKNNTVETYGAGVWDNQQYNGATPLQIDGNDISSLTASASAAGFSSFNGFSTGIMVVTLQNQVGVSIANNTIQGMGYGVILYNTQSTAVPVIGSTNTITGNSVGVYLTNIVGFNPVTTTVLGGSANNPTGVGQAILDHLDLSGNTTGALVRGDNPSSTFGVGLTLQNGVTISGGTTGLTLTGALATLNGNTVANTTFTGQSGNYITLANTAESGPLTIDGTGATFDAVTPTDNSLTDLYTIEGKITDYLDDATLGYLSLRAGNVYITQSSESANAGTIQRGVNVASNSNSIHIDAGIYVANVSVTKGLTITGAGQGNTILYPAVSNPQGAAGNSSSLNGGSNVFLVQADNVTIQQLTIDGNNPNLTSNTTSNGVDVDARNGIITDFNQASTIENNLNVNHVTVQNIYLRGIYAARGGTFDFENDTVTNVAGSPSSIAMFNFGGSGIFAHNTVSLANDAISSNWSTGVQFLDNTITNSASGIHTDNSGEFGSTDVIAGNIISNGPTNLGTGINGSFGIFVFAPYSPVSVHDNTITNVDVGLGEFGSGSVPTAPNITFANNIVDLAGRPGSIGADVSTTLLGFGSASASATLTGNSLKNGATGVFVEHDAGATSTQIPSAVLNGNTIAGNSGDGVQISGGNVLAQNNALAGNGEGVLISGGATVDLGQITPPTKPNFSGLGTSVGNNTLTGYTGAGSPNHYAIDDENSSSQPNVYAQNNNFGPVSSSPSVQQATIQQVVHDHGTNSSFSTVIFTPAQNAQPAPANVYVNAAWSGTAVGTNAATATGQGSGGTSFGVDQFSNIQQAVNAVASGGTVHIESNGPTDYFESNILVSQPETITGDSESNVVVAPAFADSHTDGSFAGTPSNGFIVASSNVTIEDLTIDGNANSALAGTQNYRDAVITNSQNDNNTYGGITLDHLNVANIYRKGLALYNLVGLSTGNSITNNTLTGIATSNALSYEGAFAIAVFQSNATISGNLITGSGAGIASNSFDGPQDGPLVSITNNTISSPVSLPSGSLGMDLASMADGSTVSGNNIDMNGGNTDDIGMVVSFVAGQVTVSGNTIGGSASDTGMLLYQDALSGQPVIVSNNKLTGTAGAPNSGVGVLLTANPADTSRFGDSGGPVYATLTGNTISNFATGVSVNSDGAAGHTVSATLGGSVAADSNSIVASGPAIIVVATGSITIEGNSLSTSGGGDALTLDGTPSFDPDVAIVSNTLNGSVTFNPDSNGNLNLGNVDLESDTISGPLTIGSATAGAGAGKVKFNEFTIKKTSDSASMNIYGGGSGGGSFGDGSVNLGTLTIDGNTVGGAAGTDGVLISAFNVTFADGSVTNNSITAATGNAFAISSGGDLVGNSLTLSGNSFTASGSGANGIDLSVGGTLSSPITMDFNHVSALQESEGIYYFFKHDDGQHQLVISNNTIGAANGIDLVVPNAASDPITVSGNAITATGNGISLVGGTAGTTNAGFTGPITISGNTISGAVGSVEILVDFLEGDPDQPIIAGNVLNGPGTLDPTSTGIKIEVDGGASSFTIQSNTVGSAGDPAAGTTGTGFGTGIELVTSNGAQITATLGGAASGNSFTNNDVAIDVNGDGVQDVVADASYNTFTSNGTAMQVLGGTLNSNNNTIEIDSYQWGVGRGISSPTGGSADRVIHSREDSADMTVDEFAAAFFVDGNNPGALPNQKWNTQFSATNDIVVGSAQPGATSQSVALYVGSGEENPSESVSLNFTKIVVTYKAIDDESSTLPINASGNYWGTNTEEGINNLITGPGSSNVGYSPWLDKATNLFQSGGFSGDLSQLDVGSGGLEFVPAVQTPSTSGRINDALSILQPPPPGSPEVSTINVYGADQTIKTSGIYHEDVVISKKVWLKDALGFAEIIGDGSNAAITVNPGGSESEISGFPALDGASKDAAKMTAIKVTLTGNTLTSSGAYAVEVDGLNADCIITGNTFQSTGVGNLLAADSSNTITGNTFTSPPSPTPNGFVQYRESDLVLDTNGYVNGLIANNTFDRGVTDQTHGAGAVGYKPIIWSDIQPVINQAAAGDTVTGTAGLYKENLSFSQDLTLDGPKAGQTGTTHDREASVPSVSELTLAPTNGSVPAVQITGGTVTVDGISIDDGALVPAVQVTGGVAQIQNNVIWSGGTSVEIDPGAAAGGYVKSSYMWYAIGGSGTSYGILVNSGAGVDIEGDDIAGTQGATGAGIYFTGTLQLDAIVSGNTIRDNEFGILTDSGNATSPSQFTVKLDNNSIYDNAIGIDHKDKWTPILITSTEFEFNDGIKKHINTIDIKLDSGAAGAVVGDGNTFSAQNFYIVNDSSQTLDLSNDPNTVFDNLIVNGAVVNGYTPQLPAGTAPFNAADQATLADNFARGDKTYDQLDDPASGYVKYFAKDVFLAVSSEKTHKNSFQRAVEVCDDGNNIYMQAGQFSDDGNGIVIDKGVTILGTNAGSSGADRESSAPSVSEIVVTKPIDIASTKLVTLDGLDISTASGDLLPAVQVSSGGAAIQNDVILAGSGGGVVADGASLTVKHNFIWLKDDIAQTGYAIKTNNVSDALITGNDIEGNGAGGASVGIYVSGTLQVTGNIISGNNIRDFTTGTWAGTLSLGSIVSGNTLTADGTGIRVDQGASATLSGNTDPGSGVGMDIAGTATITGNTISGDTTGILVESTGNATIGDSAAGDGNSIYNNTTGIEIQSGGQASITNNDFSNAGSGPSNATDVQLDSGAGAVSFGDGNAFAASTDYINNQGSQGIDFSADTATTFGGVNAPALAVTTANLPSFYLIEDKIVDAIDASGLGLVRLHSGNLFVTPNSFLAPATNDAGAIQRAVNVAAVADTINVEAGTYSENLNIPLQVNLIGAGSGGSGTVINPISGSSPIITIAGSGADASHLLTVSQVALNGGTIGIEFNSAVSNVLLSDLAITGSTNEGIEVHNSAVLTNLILTGDIVQTMNNGGVGFRIATTGTIKGLNIDSSHFDNSGYGFYSNEDTSSSNNQNGLTNVSITNSTFNNDFNRGIYVEKLDHAVLNGITVSGSGTSAPGTGIDINLKGGTFTNIEIENSQIANSGSPSSPGGTNGFGLAIKGRNDGSNASNPGILSGVTLLNLTISNSPTDLYIDNDTSGITFSGLQLNGSGIGLSFGATAPQTVALADTIFDSHLLAYIVNFSPNTIDATSATFGAVGPADNTLADLYGVEDKIIDRLDQASNGFVRLRTGQVFVAASSEAAPTGSAGAINRAVGVSASSDTVFVQAGSFTDDVVVDKTLTLLGAQAGIDPTVPGGRSGAESVITGTGANAPIQIASGVNNVTINGFTIQSPANGSGALAAGIWLGGSTGVTIDYDIIQNNTTGIAVASSGGTINHDMIQSNNAQGPGSGSGIEFYAGSTPAWDISANIFTNNDNGDVMIAPGGQVVANVSITHNTFPNSTGNPLFALTADNLIFSFNHIIHSNFSAIALGGGDTNIQILNNDITGSTTAVRVVDAFGAGPNSNITVSNNFLEDNQYGVRIDSGALSGSMSVNDNSIGQDVNTPSIPGNSIAGIENDSSVTIDATDNWWGSPTGPTNAANPGGIGDQIIGSNVTFAPWLTNGADVQDGRADGFQPSANQPLVAQGGQTANFLEAQEADNVLVATFFDPTNPSGDLTNNHYSADIDWGDGTGDQLNSAIVTYDPTHGVFDVFGSHTYAEEEGSPFTITVQLHKQGVSTNPAPVTSTGNVGEAPITLTGGQTVNSVEAAPSGQQLLATFLDPGNPNGDLTESGEYAGTIDWGDGTPGHPDVTSFTSASITYDPTTDLFHILGAHTYAEEGAYTISVTLQHETLPQLQVTSTAQVADHVLTNVGAIPNITVPEGSGTVQVLLAKFQDPGNPAGDLSETGEYSADINWGDGTGNHVNSGTIQYDNDPSSPTFGDFLVYGTHSFGAFSSPSNPGSGPFTVTVKIHHEVTNPVTVSTTVTVTDAALHAGALTPPVATEGQSFSNLPVFHFTDDDINGVASDYTAVVSLGDGNSVTLTSAPSANGQIVASGTGFDVQLSYTYAEEFTNKTFSVTVYDNSGGRSITDPSDATASASTNTFSVADAALHAGALTPPVATEGEPFSNATVFHFTDDDPAGTAGDYTAVVTLGDGNMVTLTSAPSAKGQIVASGTGFDVQLSYTYAEEFTNQTFGVTVYDDGDGRLITDPTDASTSASTTFSVADAPVTAGTVTAGGGIEDTAPTTLSASFTDANTLGATADFNGTIDWGDGTPGNPDTTSFTSADVTGGNGNFTVHGSHQYAEEGPYNITVTVNDDGGSMAVITGSTTVADAPLTGGTNAGASAGIEGVTAATLSNAAFTDANAAAPLTDFTIQSVVWGDGSTDATGLTITGSNGSYSVNGSHLYAEEGTYNFTITVKDVGGNTAVIAGSTTVADAPLTGSSAAAASGGIEGVTSATLSNATFSDANAAAPLTDFTVQSVDWGDNTSSPAGLTITGSNGNYSVNGSHLYAEEGTYNFTITVLDDGGNTAVITGSTTVADAPLTGSSNASASGGFEGATPAALSNAAFTDANPGAPAADFTVMSVDWGDNSTDATGLTITGSNGSYSVNGSHLYGEEGVYNFTITVKDDGGSTAVITGSATVADAPLADRSTNSNPTASEGASTGPVVVATFSDANPGDHTADFFSPGGSVVIDWGDGSPADSGVIVNYNSGTGVYSVIGTHTYAEEGNYLVTVDVADDGGSTLTGIGKTAVTVADQQITNLVANVPLNGQEGLPLGAVTGIATFTDPAGVGLETTADFTATINWGDASTSPGTIVSLGGGNYRVDAPSHTYIEEGTYNVTVTVKHDQLPPVTTAAQTITIADAPLTAGAFTPPTAVEGVPITNVTVFHFTDADPNGNPSDYTALITPGDGTTGFVVTSTPSPRGQIVASPGGGFDVQMSYMYAEEFTGGTFTVVAIDLDGGTGGGGQRSTTSQGTNNFSLGDAPLTAGTLSATGGVAGTTPTNLSASFTDANTGATNADFSGTIDWGDGTPANPDITTFTSSSVSGSGGSYTVNASHTYAVSGNFNISVKVNDDGGQSATINGSTAVAPAVTVAAEYVFYNNSKYDGNDPNDVPSTDFNAIATDKTPLLPGGTGSFNNYTSFSRGLNGVWIDFAGLPANTVLSSTDFTFKVGNNNTPSSWTTLTGSNLPTAVVMGTDPVTNNRAVDIVWADNVIQNEWLQVTVLGGVNDTNTHLASNFVFYYGNLIAETGNSTTDARVTAADVTLTQNNVGPATVGITNDYDFNRDGRVTAADVTIAQNSVSPGSLQLITVPAGSAAPAVLAATPAAAPAVSPVVIATGPVKPTGSTGVSSTNTPSPAPKPAVRKSVAKSHARPVSKAAAVSKSKEDQTPLFSQSKISKPALTTTKLLNTRDG